MNSRQVALCKVYVHIQQQGVAKLWRMHNGDALVVRLLVQDHSIEVVPAESVATGGCRLLAMWHR